MLATRAAQGLCGQQTQCLAWGWKNTGVFPHLTSKDAEQMGVGGSEG